MTGGTKGIGRAAAAGLLQAGTSVGSCARAETEVRTVAAQLGERALGIVCDVADDCAVAVLQLLSYPKEAYMSRIEIRPSMPPRIGYVLTPASPDT